MWRLFELIAFGSVPGKFFSGDGGGGSDALDVNYDVNLGGGEGGGAADDVTDFGGDTAARREEARAAAEDYIPPDDQDDRSDRSDDQGDQGRERGGGRRDVARERQDRDARGGGERGRQRGKKPEDLPEHRFDQLNQKFERTMRMMEQQLESERRQNRRFRMALGVNERPEPRRYNEREQRIRTQLERTYPELALLSNAKLHRLLERSDDLDRIVTEAPLRGQEENRRWGGHAERMVRQALNHAATQWLGKEKTFKDLEADDRDEIDHAFTRFVMRRAEEEEKELPEGHYGETTLRYEAGDPSLVNEFWTWFTRRHGSSSAGPGRARQDGAAAAARADAAARGVRGGSSSAAMGSPRREVKPKTLDQALDEGWSYVQNERAGA